MTAMRDVSLDFDFLAGYGEDNARVIIQESCLELLPISKIKDKRLQFHDLEYAAYNKETGALYFIFVDGSIKEVDFPSLEDFGVGLLGREGLPGYDGYDAFDGCDGKQGEKGCAGIPGFPGKPGLEGDPGNKGYSGPRGEHGIQGFPGGIGPIGEKGPPDNCNCIYNGSRGIFGGDGKDEKHYFYVKVCKPNPAEGTNPIWANITDITPPNTTSEATYYENHLCVLLANDLAANKVWYEQLPQGPYYVLKGDAAKYSSSVYAHIQMNVEYSVNSGDSACYAYGPDGYPTYSRMYIKYHAVELNCTYNFKSPDLIRQFPDVRFIDGKLEFFLSNVKQTQQDSRNWRNFYLNRNTFLIFCDKIPAGTTGGTTNGTTNSTCEVTVNTTNRLEFSAVVINAYVVLDGQNILISNNQINSSLGPTTYTISIPYFYRNKEIKMYYVVKNIVSNQISTQDRTFTFSTHPSKSYVLNGTLTSSEFKIEESNVFTCS